jgi:hypothetical protein
MKFYGTVYDIVMRTLRVLTKSRKKNWSLNNRLAFGVARAANIEQIFELVVESEAHASGSSQQKK